MRNLLLTSSLLFINFLLFAQGNTCNTAEPFCTGSVYTFPAGVNQTAASTQQPGNNYGCLATSPNPAWYYMEIDQPGNLTINMTNSSNVDIDFILYGPYSSLANAMSYCGNMGTASSGSSVNTVVDCSYSTAANESATISNAQTGQVYVLLITNFSNQNTNISFTNSGSSTATTNCNIVNPECLISNFTANIGACITNTGVYNVTGSITYSDPPSTGNLVVQDCFGTQHVVASAGSLANTGTVNYTINGLPANGAGCSLTAFFTSETTCTSQTINYTAPTCSCNFTFLSTNISACDPNTNTFNITGSVEFVNAPSTGTLTISDCTGNTQTFNAPFTSPINYALNDINSNGTTNCSVTASFSANPSCSITSSPFNYPSGCICDADAGTYTSGIIGESNSVGPYNLCFGDNLVIIGNGDFIPSEDFSVGGTVYSPGVWLLVYDCPPTIGVPNDIIPDPCLLGVASSADQAWAIANNSGSGQTLYFVPVTMYDMVNGYYAISLNGGAWCYDMGPVYPVTFLPQMTTTQTTNCQAGTATITVSGGQPAVTAGSQFTASNLQPAHASFVNSTTGNNGTIEVQGLLDGDNFSFTIEDVNGCPVNITGSFTGVQSAAFTYPDNQYCQNEANPLPTITGVAGGTFTSTPAGLSINASTGLINLATSTPGTYTVTYQSPDPICFGTATFQITVDPLPVVTVNDPSFCVGGSATLTANGAATYEWSPAAGLSATTGASVVATPASTTDYTVTGTSAAGCVNSDVATVTVNPNPVAAITGPDEYCAGTTATLNAGPGFASYVWSTGATTQTIQATAANNPITVTVTNAQGCSHTSPAFNLTEVLNITTNQSFVICQGESMMIHGQLQTTSGLYSQTFVSALGCDSISNVTLTVNPLPNVNAGNDQAFCAGQNVTLTATGASTYVWSPAVGLSSTTNASVTASPALTTTYTVTGTDGNGCVNSDQVVVTVNALPVVNGGQDVNVCEGTPVTLTATGAENYGWSGGITNGVAFTQPVGIVTYTVTGTDANGCQATDQVVVTVSATPTVIAGNDIVVCAGQSVVLTASGASSYAWDNGVINGVAFVPTETITYTVVGTVPPGCQNTDQVTVTVIPIPQPEFSGNNLYGCAPLTPNFTNLSVGDFQNCVWNFGNGQTQVGCGNAATTYNTPGCYDVTLTVTTPQGCTNTVTYNNFVCVEADPLASFTANPQIMTSLNPSTQFINSSIGASNYQWSFGDGSPTSTDVNPSHVYPNQAGTYIVTLTAYSPAGCQHTVTEIVIVREELIFYVPNAFTPDNDQYNETFKPVFTAGFDPYNENYQLLIFNRWGELLFESYDYEVGWDGKYGGKLVQDGVYIWKITYKRTGVDDRETITGHVTLIR
jgi:gliding motility-associated-like protein